MEDTFKYKSVDEITHDEDLCNFAVIQKQCSIEDSYNSVSLVPISIVRLENYYDMYGKFRGVNNYKNSISYTNYKTVNLGTTENP